jgi:glucose-1-phosphate cytidylyltransferase
VPEGRVTVILCGGKGTRAYPHTAEVPKPLLEVAGEPILRHVMEIYARQGFVRFVLAAGFQAQKIAAFADALPSAWEVEVVDTGEDADTGERVWRCRHLLEEPFFLTYGDGLGDVDLHALTEFHTSHGALATLTTVPLPSQYGTIEIAGAGLVTEFKEKPVLKDHWINGGFFVMEPGVWASWGGTNLERDVLPELAGEGQLYAYRHHGFWKSMDTYKDAVDITMLASERTPPWLGTPAASPSSTLRGSHRRGRPPGAG